MIFALKKNVFALLISFSLLSMADVFKATEIVSVSPMGSVKNAQQVQVKFSADMIALGDQRALRGPLTLECTPPQSFTTKWADTKTWTAEFDKPLKSGVKCSLKLKPDANDLAGHGLKANDEYTFSTSGPNVVEIVPRYQTIQSDQHFVIQIDGPLDSKSVERIAYFEVEGIPERVAMKVVEGNLREQILAAGFQQEWSWKNIYKRLKKSDGTMSKSPELENFLVLKAARQFPENKKVNLHWPKGILSKTGLPTTEAQAYSYTVISPFAATFNCERSAANRPCNPILNMYLSLNRPVPISHLKGVKLIGPNGREWLPEELNPKEKGSKAQSSTGSRSHKRSKVYAAQEGSGEETTIGSLTFKGPFPEKSDFKLQIPLNIKDELNRVLSNQAKFPLDIKTDDYSPLVKFSAPFGILESKTEALLPLNVRNIELNMPEQMVSIEGQSMSLGSKSEPFDIIRWLRRTENKEYLYDQRGVSIFAENKATTKKMSIKKPSGEREFELIGIPLGKPGFHVVEVESPRLGNALLGKGTMYVASSALVTNMGVHFKKGRESSLVWVSSLDSAKPVPGAEVGIYTALGIKIGSSKTDENGIAKFKALNFPCGFKLKLDDKEESDDEYGNATDKNNYPGFNRCEVFAFAKKDEDVSFVSDQWNRGIETYRYGVNTEYLNKRWGPIEIHTVFDRSLLQLGETIHMKHVLRETSQSGFKEINPKVLPTKVIIVHSGTNKSFTLPFKYDNESGTALNEFVVPKEAPLGSYSVFLTNKQSLPKKNHRNDDEFDWSARNSGHFTVSEYRLPLMEATVKIQGQELIQPKQLSVDLSANYLSGGPAKKLGVNVRAELSRGYFRPEVVGGDRFSFFDNPVAVGISDDESSSTESKEKPIPSMKLELGADGGAKVVIPGLPKVTKVSELTVEMEYSDPNGEVKTASTSRTIFPAEYIVGLGTDSWVSSPGKVAAKGVVINVAGKPVPNQSYVVEAFMREYITHRKKLVGGFYSYDSRREIKSLGKICEGKTNEKGRFECKADKVPPGSVILQAKVSDSKGRTTFAQESFSVYEEGANSWWAVSDSDRIDLLPERKKYEPGETAKFVIRSPFVTSTVLVTLEREGVLESFVRTVQRDNPVIEIPINGEYSPNIFVSALAIRGRTNDSKPDFFVDLGKPAMKLGMAEINVGWKAHELKVSVIPSGKKFNTRDKVEVKVKVSRADGKELPSNSEAAIAVVDEALLRLSANDSWNLLDKMMGHRGLAVETSSGQNQVIGKRHFGLKAKPPGGGGGDSSAEPRQLFNPMIYWNPKLKLNSQGEATFTMTLNDSITSFRIEAVAQGAFDFFGSGESSIQATKDLILYSGFSPVVRNGDQVRNVLTVRNASTEAMKLDLKVKSPADMTVDARSIPSFDLAAGQSKIFEIQSEVGAKSAGVQDWLVEAKNLNGKQSDSLKIAVKVSPAVPDRVTAATLFQLDKAFDLPVQQAPEALAGRGSISIDASHSLVAGLPTVKSYMEDYPYSCLEQSISKAVALEKKSDLAAIVGKMPSYLDADGLLKFFPSSQCGSPQLTRYVVKILEANEISLPETLKESLASGLSTYLKGQLRCHEWWETFVSNNFRDQERLLSLETLSALKKFDPSSLSAITLSPNLWKTETLVAWIQLLQREVKIEGRDTKLSSALNSLKARINYQGTLMSLQGDLGWEASWRLFTSPDQEALAVFNLAIDEKSMGEDIGKLARGIVARQKRGVWDTTLSNAWGVTALNRFAKKFETEKVSGQSKVIVAGVESEKSTATWNWKDQPMGETKKLDWPTDSTKKASHLNFSHSGGGKPWMMVQTKSAIPLKEPLDMGFKVSRTLNAISQKVPGKWSYGDVAEVQIKITAKSDQPWVVVKDPVASGSSHLGNGLSGSSEILNRASAKASPSGKGKKAAINAQEEAPEAWPTEFEEKSLSYYVGYAAYLPKGTYLVNYRIRFNSAGKFKMPPVRVEAMYSPENFGEAPIGDFLVEP